MLTHAHALLRRGWFEFRTRDEAVSIAQFVTASMPEPVRAEVALTELMLNAVEHGNLEISGTLKVQLVRAGALDAEIARRLALTPFRDRIVLVEVLRAGESTDIVITDEGKGFAWRSMLCGAVDEIEPVGRGLALALSCGCMISYNEAGNSVTVRFR